MNKRVVHLPTIHTSAPTTLIVLLDPPVVRNCWAQNPNVKNQVRIEAYLEFIFKLYGQGRMKAKASKLIKISLNFFELHWNIILMNAYRKCILAFFVIKKCSLVKNDEINKR